MKRTMTMRIIFIVAALVVVAACGTSSPPAQPSPAANAVPAGTQATPEPTPTPTPLAAPDDLPPAVQILSAEYQAAYRLLPDGEWAQKFYLATTFDDFDPDWFANASDTPPSSTAIPIQPLGPGREFNLKRVLGKEDEDTVSWVEAKVAELAPSYGDKFAKAEGTDARYAVLDEAVMAGEVRATTLEVEIFFRWQALVSGMTEEMADLDAKRTLQMIGYFDMTYTLSDKERIIRRNELRVCELLMTEIVGVPHTLDVVQNNECDLEKAVELANGAILSGKKPPTEDEYKAWFDNTDLDFSVETVEEYARWCGRTGDPVAKELDKGKGISGWGNIAEVLVLPIREAEAIDPVPNGLEEFHKAKLASLKGMSDLARTKHHGQYVDTIEIRKEAATLDPLEEALTQASEGLSPEIASALRQSGCI